MRRDLLITALVFLAIGFAGGVIYKEYAGGFQSAPRPPAAVGGAAAGAADTELPAGHPPMDVAQRWSQLQQHAEANPDDPRAALELANFLHDIQRWEPAIVWYQKVLELEPQNTDARTDLGTCYYNLGRFQEAAAEFERALAVEPAKPQALYNLALTRLRQGEPAAARQTFRRLQRSNPDFEGVERLAEILEREAPTP